MAKPIYGPLIVDQNGQNVLGDKAQGIQGSILVNGDPAAESTALWQFLVIRRQLKYLRLREFGGFFLNTCRVLKKDGGRIIAIKVKTLLYRLNGLNQRLGDEDRERAAEFF